MSSTSDVHAAGWPNKVVVLNVQSSVDGTKQPTIFFAPEQEHPSQEASLRPLLVALHTWSADYSQAGGQTISADWCIRHGWYLLHPNFRGPNSSPSACGSDLAIQDILDAVDHVVVTGREDTNRIYVVGVSGGGHMALLLASRHPQLWAGVSAWAAISDLGAWWKELSHNHKGPAYLQNYVRQIEAVVGDKPDGSNVEAINECRRRSPLTYLSSELANQVSLDINAGIMDGRKGSVPFSHSLRAFDALLPSSKNLGEEWVAEFYNTRQCPSYDGPSLEPLYENRKIHYRNIQDALNWLSQQRRGQDTVWETPSDTIDWFEVDGSEEEAGK